MDLTVPTLGESLFQIKELNFNLTPLRSDCSILNFVQSNESFTLGIYNFIISRKRLPSPFHGKQ